jgi:hypothetical protein
MQGTVVMLLALSGLGCHHKQVAPSYGGGCYSSCYSDFGCYSTCYSSGCYSSGYSSCYSSCYSGGYSGCYSQLYSSGYSGYSCAPRHRHGLFGCKRNSCAACCGTGYGSVGGFGYDDLPVYGSYTPVYDGYATSQGPMIQGPGSSYGPTYGTNPMTPPAAAAPMAPEPTTPPAPSPGNPAPNPASAVPTPPAAAPPTTTVPPTPVPGF